MSAVVIRASAPGKIILHGEHSVVYGKLAIAASLDLRTRVTITETRTGPLLITFADLVLERSYDMHHIELMAQNLKPFTENHDEYLALIETLNEIPDESQRLSLTAFLYLYFGILLTSNVEFVPLHVHVKTELSLGAGTGSSASLMVTLSGALLEYCRQKIGADVKLAEISEWAFRAEKIIHGNPSGIDNTVCTYGSFVTYRKNGSSDVVKSARKIKALLVDSAVPKNTGMMVQKVAMKRTEQPEVVDRIFSEIEDITNEALSYMNKELKFANINNVYNLLRRNHSCLVNLGLSHPALDDIVQTMRDYSLEGKITGAGGGGYVFTILAIDYPHGKLDSLCDVLTHKGYVPKVTQLGGAGFTID